MPASAMTPYVLYDKAKATGQAPGSNVKGTAMQGVQHARGVSASLVQQA